MAERLFQNQLRPQAQPINQFIQPQQFRRAGAAQQPLLGRVSQIATQQQAGTSGVKGFNQFSQMAEALAPYIVDGEGEGCLVMRREASQLVS